MAREAVMPRHSIKFNSNPGNESEVERARKRKQKNRDARLESLKKEASRRGVSHRVVRRESWDEVQEVKRRSSMSIGPVYCGGRPGRIIPRNSTVDSH